MAPRGTKRIVALAALVVVGGSAAAAWGYHQHADAELVDEREVAAMLRGLDGTTGEHATAHGPAFFRTTVAGGAENIVQTYDVEDADAARADLEARLALMGWRHEQNHPLAAGNSTDFTDGDGLWVRMWETEGGMRLWIGEIGG